MPTKISFFIARHSISGVPLAQIRLAKSFQRRGYDVEFVTGYVPEGLVLLEIPGINVINFDIPRTYKLLFPIISYLRRAKPDVIFSAEDHLNAVVTIAVILLGSKARLSMSSRVTPYDTYSNRVLSKRWVLKQINRMVWYRSDALVCVSKDMVKQYEAIFGRTKFQCIYNVVCDSELDSKMSEAVNDPWFDKNSSPLIIAAGRLAPEKGYPDLIKAMKILIKTTDARLAILGDGPLRPVLEALIEQEKLTDIVKLMGFQKNPYKYYSKARVSVLSSYVEGLPNVLVEAMACGCTPVSTDCPTGPREVLNGGEYGFLVPAHNPEAMAHAIKLAFEQPTSPELLKKAIFPFTEDQVVKQHQNILGF
jgi:glycosyltransferase involved in cell wall biosynthesis